MRFIYRFFKSPHSILRACRISISSSIEAADGILQAPLPSVLQSRTHGFPSQITLLGISSARARNEPLGRKEHGDPALLPPLAGVLSDPKNPSLPQELGERSSPPPESETSLLCVIGRSTLVKPRDSSHNPRSSYSFRISS